MSAEQMLSKILKILRLWNEKWDSLKSSIFLVLEMSAGMSVNKLLWNILDLM